MAYLGDFTLGDTLDFKFSTVGTTGAPTTLAGTPVVSAYVGNSTTQLTAGITLTVDFDGVTGLHNVRVVASGANGYAAQTNVDLVITTGTVGGTSVVGYVIGSFSIENRSTQAIRAKTDNLPAAPAAVGDIPTAVQNADALLGRNVSGGSSTGRTVKQALHVLRNRSAVAAGTLTVFDTDDTTSSWTATVSSDATADPITGIDPT
jgi:hypothetical protein